MLKRKIKIFKRKSKIWTLIFMYKKKFKKNNLNFIMENKILSQIIQMFSNLQQNKNQ